MESLLQGIPKVCAYIDDVLVAWTTEEDHLANLTEVLRCMSSNEIRLKREKCQFMLNQVHYLRHVVSNEGIQPTQDKISAIQDTPAPTDLHQLKSFLGLLNFYARFLPSLSTVLAPLYSLLQKNQPWSWGPRQQRAFRRASNCSLRLPCSFTAQISTIYSWQPTHLITLWSWRSVVASNARQL